MQEHQGSPGDVEAVSTLYHALLRAWNERQGAAFAAKFAADGHVVGFDGSQMAGPDEIGATIAGIFADHQTGRYVGQIRAVQLLRDTALVRAVAGVVPHGREAIDPALNSVQALVAVRRAGRWQILLYQNTPAQFHGRPELADALSAELQQLFVERTGGGRHG